MDRVYRLGQQKNVVVYRLITVGTVEEKIYRKQVFKGSLVKTVIDKKDYHRYFTQQELCELFQLDSNLTQSVTQQQLKDLHSNMRVTDPQLDKHILFLHSLEISGISDHDLLFTEKTEKIEVNDEVIVQTKEAQNRLFENNNGEDVRRRRVRQDIPAKITPENENGIPIDEVLEQMFVSSDSVKQCECDSHQDIAKLAKKPIRCSCNLSTEELMWYNHHINKAR